MRIYLVKTEEEFTRFALMKYQEEIKTTNQVGSTQSSRVGMSGKTQACSDKSHQSVSGNQKLKGGAQRQNKTANEVGCTSNLNQQAIIGKKQCQRSTNVCGEISSIIDNFGVSAGTSCSIENLQLSSAEADSSKIVDSNPLITPINLDSVTDNNVLVGSSASLLEKAGPAHSLLVVVASQEETKCGR